MRMRFACQNSPFVLLNSPSIALNLPSLPLNLPFVPLNPPSVPLNSPSVPPNPPSVPLNSPSVPLNSPCRSQSQKVQAQAQLEEEEDDDDDDDDEEEEEESEEGSSDSDDCSDSASYCTDSTLSTSGRNPLEGFSFGDALVSYANHRYRRGVKRKTWSCAARSVCGQRGWFTSVVLTGKHQHAADTHTMAIEARGGGSVCLVEDSAMSH
eukprot:1179492-Prorocentrum_minimum.AAC.2